MYVCVFDFVLIAISPMPRLIYIYIHINIVLLSYHSIFGMWVAGGGIGREREGMGGISNLVLYHDYQTFL